MRHAATDIGSVAPRLCALCMDQYRASHDVGAALKVRGLCAPRQLLDGPKRRIHELEILRLWPVVMCCKHSADGRLFGMLDAIFDRSSAI